MACVWSFFAFWFTVFLLQSLLDQWADWHCGWPTEETQSGSTNLIR